MAQFITQSRVRNIVVALNVWFDILPTLSGADVIYIIF